MVDTPNADSRHAELASYTIDSCDNVFNWLNMNFSHDIVYKCLEYDVTFPQRGPPTSYIVSDDTAARRPNLTKCLLCDIGGLTTAEMELHCKGLPHLGKVHALQEDLNKVLMSSHRVCAIYSQPLCRDIAMLDQIVHAAWKRDIQAELYNFMIAPPVIVSPEAFCKRREAELLERPTKKLKTTLQNERLTLLGLAVWKAKCMCQIPPVTDYHGVQEWLRSDWKTCKAEQLTSNAMDIIVSAVRSFLD
jgi:hypothetical protein